MHFKKLKLVLVIIAISFLHVTRLTAQEKIGDNCGTWRWNIKTATDEQGLTILEGNVVNTTFDKLVNLQRPEKVGKTSPRFTDEMKLVKFKAILVEHKLVGGKGDTDFHIVIQDPNSKETMIIEIPNPDCGVFENNPDIKERIESTR